MRGTFANIRIKNQMVPGVEGGVTIHYPDGQQMPIYDAAMRYKADGVPLVIFAGREYGTGSSRDWAAKGTRLLGVRAVIAQSFERIHRSNLVGMGVLPLVFEEGVSWKDLGLKGSETVTIHGIKELKPLMRLMAISPSRMAQGRMCRCSAGSIRSMNSTTSRAAASCITCCGTLPQPDQFENRFKQRPGTLGLFYAILAKIMRNLPCTVSCDEKGCCR